MPPVCPGIRKHFPQVFLRAAVQIQPGGLPEHFRFLRHHFQFPVPYPVSIHDRRPDAPLPEIIVHLPFDILGDRPGFLLRIRRKQGKHKFPVLPQRMDILLLKIHIHPNQPELPDRLQCRDRIPGKPRNGLRNDQVDIPGPAFRQHLLELAAPVLRPGNRLVTLCQEQDLKYFIFFKKQTRASPLNHGHPCALLFYPTLKPPLDMYRPSFLRLCLSAFKTSD